MNVIYPYDDFQQANGSGSSGNRRRKNGGTGNSSSYNTSSDPAKASTQKGSEVKETVDFGIFHVQKIDDNGRDVPAI